MFFVFFLMCRWQSLQNIVSLWLMTGPLSTLPPDPSWSQRGGAQPPSQWQLWLLLHSWRKEITLYYLKHNSIDHSSHFIHLAKWVWKLQPEEDMTLRRSGKQPENFKWHALPLTPCPWHLAWHSSALRKDALRHSPLKQIFERKKGVGEKEQGRTKWFLSSGRNSSCPSDFCQKYHDDYTQLYMLNLTESTSHLVPVMTRPGSRVSPCASSSPCPVLYTCVPMQRTFLLPMVTVVSMRTALFSMGLEAEDKHWIFPQMASLVRERRERCVIDLNHVDTQSVNKLSQMRSLKNVHVHLSLQLLYFPKRSLPQFPYMSPASFTFLKQTSGAARPSVIKRETM